MSKFTITDSENRTLYVEPMATGGLYFISDEKGHACEFGYNVEENKWIVLSSRVTLSPFLFDNNEVGNLIEEYMNS